MEKNENRVVTVCEAYYAFTENVDSIVKSAGFGVTVLLNTGVEWEKIPFTEGTASVKEKAVRRQAGRCYEQEFIADLAGEDVDTTEWMDEIDGRPAVVKIVQTNGTKIFGDTENPVRLLCDWGSDNGGATIGFTRDAVEKARWLTEDESGSGE